MHRSFLLAPPSPYLSIDLRKTVNPRLSPLRQPPSANRLNTQTALCPRLAPDRGAFDRDRGVGPLSHCAAQFSSFSCCFRKNLPSVSLFFPRCCAKSGSDQIMGLCYDSFYRGVSSFLGLIVIVGRLGEEMRILYGVIAIGVVITRRFRDSWTLDLTEALCCLFMKSNIVTGIT
jgi:hypothetical protein